MNSATALALILENLPNVVALAQTLYADIAAGNGSNPITADQLAILTAFGQKSAESYLSDAGGEPAAS